MTLSESYKSLKKKVLSGAISLSNYPVTPTHKGAAILMYHTVGEVYPDGKKFSEQHFRNHLEYLTSNWEVVKLENIVYASEDLPGRVALTFDGGYQDFYHTVLPILREYNVPATVFVASERVGLQNNKSKYTESWADWFNYITKDELYEVNQDPLITIGNKTLTHRCTLPELSDAECDWEVGEGKRQLESELGIEIDGFCYPKGEATGRTARIVGKYHDYAVTTQPNFCGTDANKLFLPRFTADWTSVKTLRQRLTNKYVLENNFRRFLHRYDPRTNEQKPASDRG